MLTDIDNDTLDTRLTAAIEDARLQGVDTTPGLEVLFAERTRRINARQAELMADSDNRVITVKLTPAQADLLIVLLPESCCDLEVLATRAKGTPDQFQDAFEFIKDDADMAVDYMESNRMSDATPEQADFAERNTRKCHKLLCGKLRKAARR